MAFLQGKNNIIETQFMQKQLKKLCIEKRLRFFPSAVVIFIEAQIEFVEVGVI